MSLRKTCKLLKPFLPTESQKPFDDSYVNMIDAVNEMDVVSTAHAVSAIKLIVFSRN